MNGTRSVRPSFVDIDICSGSRARGSQVFDHLWLLVRPSMGLLPPEIQLVHTGLGTRRTTESQTEKKSDFTQVVNKRLETHLITTFSSYSLLFFPYRSKHETL